MKEIEYYKINEILSHKYYQIPKELCESSLYKFKLNSDSKLLYSFLLDRLTLSQKHNWYDEDKNIYLIFTREEVQEKLNLSDKTVTKAFKLLSQVNLVREKRQGLGKPNLIYVGKIQYEEIIETENLRSLNRKNYDSGGENLTTLDSENLRGINTNNINTDINYTNSINPNSEECSLNNIKEKCKLSEFTKKEISILEDVIDTLYYSDSLKVGAVTVNNLKILSKLKLIVKENLTQLLEILKNTNGIQNTTNYLMICLYNNLGNTHIIQNKKSSVSARENDRKYPEGYFDTLYANCSFENAVVTS